MNKKKIPLFHLNEELQIEPTRSRPGFAARIVGIKAHHYLILDRTDAEPRLIQPLEPNHYVWVRYPPNMVFRFRSKVLNQLSDPTYLIVLEYPPHIEEVNFRRSERKKTFIKGEFSYLKNNRRKQSGNGYILDISDSGCLIWDDFVHLMNSNLMVRFELPKSGEEFQAKARVVRSAVIQRGICSGLRFIDLDVDRLRQLKICLQDTDSQRKAATPS